MNEPPDDLDYWEIPRCWPGECVAVLAGGRSLRISQVEHLRGKCRVVAINRAFQLAPWADWLYGCDPDHDRFWGRHPEAVEFKGTKVVVRGVASVRWQRLADLAKAGVKILRHSSREWPCLPRHVGASGDPGVVLGNNSLHQVLSVIAHTGASTVLLLGADMRGGHWHEGWGYEPDYENAIVPNFQGLVKPLAAADVTVINCSPGSRLEYWPILPVEAVL